MDLGDGPSLTLHKEYTQLAVRRAHDWMPVVAAVRAWPAWLGEQIVDPRHLKAQLAPHRDEMVCGPRASGVGNDQNLIDPNGAAAD